ncbi:hypothetical protein KFZ76_17995 [Methylovulum psychrotolerans]|uniref:hypothetical protein n=1 Tax=Methylovulum psychrotolerans TaxID=1704499 RepID=UPI001BFF1B16|nr:hypothetical protein [Methylovulum psychrotolerans]MBT9099592.1 hypothetical protein [Methylovulum psychrotolerans]
MSDLTAQITANRSLGEAVCQRLSAEIDKLGFAASEALPYPQYDEARFELVKDPYTGGHNLACHWFNHANKQRLGKLQFNSDGSFYAEFDVVKPHPRKSQWFVEGVTAWGQADNIKAEAKLLPLTP